MWVFLPCKVKAECTVLFSFCNTLGKWWKSSSSYHTKNVFSSPETSVKRKSYNLFWTTISKLNCPLEIPHWMYSESEAVVCSRYTAFRWVKLREMHLTFVFLTQNISATAVWTKKILPLLYDMLIAHKRQTWHTQLMSVNSSQSYLVASWFFPSLSFPLLPSLLEKGRCAFHPAWYFLY